MVEKRFLGTGLHMKEAAMQEASAGPRAVKATGSERDIVRARAKAARMPADGCVVRLQDPAALACVPVPGGETANDARSGQPPWRHGPDREGGCRDRVSCRPTIARSARTRRNSPSCRSRPCSGPPAPRARRRARPAPPAPAASPRCSRAHRPRRRTLHAACP